MIDLPHVCVSSSSTHPSHTFERGRNTFLHDIHKNVQPLTLSGIANVKHETLLSFLEPVEILFEGELSDKEKVRAVSFFVERTSPPLVDPYENRQRGSQQRSCGNMV